MKRKILAMTLLLAIVASMLAFVSCVDDEEHEAIKVKMVLLNPYTGEPVNSKTVIEVPPENTPLVWQVVVMETGEVLTDEDLPGTTLAESIRIGEVYKYYVYEDMRRKYRISTDGNWPTEPGYYTFGATFDCLPKGLSHPEKWQRKYGLGFGGSGATLIESAEEEL